MRKITLILLVLFVFPVPSLAREKIYLTMTGEDISEIVALFNASQENYEVVVEEQPFRNWFAAENRFRQEMKSSKDTSTSGIDIALVDNNWLPEMIHKGWLADLTGVIPDGQALVKGLDEPASVHKKIYALPFSNKGQVLFYRKDWHEKHGLTPPQTLAELRHNAQVFMEKEKTTHGLTIHFSAMHLDVLPLLWSNGGDILDDGRPVLNSSENIETLIFLQEMGRLGLLPGPATVSFLKKSYSNARVLFENGESPFLITWNNRLQALNTSKISGRFGVLPLPSLKEGQTNFSVIGSWYFAIPASSRNQKGALAFLRFFYSEEVQALQGCGSVSYLPILQSVYLDDQLRQKNPWITDLGQAMAFMRHRLLHRRETEINSLVEQGVRNILIKGWPVRETLEKLQDRVKLLLAEDRGD